MSGTNWLPGLLVLLLGVVAGVLFVLLSRKGHKPAQAGTDPVLDDLEQRYQMLIGQLKELVADKHLLPQEQFDSERSRLEREAAAVLKAKDDHLRGVKHEAEKAAARQARQQKAAEAAAQTFLGRNPALKGALVGGGVVGFFALLFALLGQESKLRTDEPMTGGPPQKQEQPGRDEKLEALVDKLKRNSDDIEVLAEVAHELIRRQAFDDAESLVNQALGMDPHHVETRIHHAVILAVDGDGATALHQLEHLARTYAGAHEALLFAGVLSMQMGDKGRALRNFERFLSEAPPAEVPPGLREGIVKLRQEVGTGGG